MDDLDGNKINWSGFSCFLTIKSDNLINLKKLDMGRNNLGQRGAQYLAKGNLPRL